MVSLSVQSWFHYLFMFFNDLQHVTEFLDAIMLVDDTNSFCSNSNIYQLFKNANKERVNITNRFFDNKMSIDARKAKYIFS